MIALLDTTDWVTIACAVGALLLGPFINLAIDRGSNVRARARWSWNERPVVDKTNRVRVRLHKRGTQRSELSNAMVVERLGFWGKVFQWLFVKKDNERVWYQSGLWVLDGNYLTLVDGTPVKDLGRSVEDQSVVVLNGRLLEQAYLPGPVRFWKWGWRRPRRYRLRVFVETSAGKLRKRPKVISFRGGVPAANTAAADLVP